MSSELALSGFSICAAFSFTSVKGASFGNPMLWEGGGRDGATFLLFKCHISRITGGLCGPLAH